MTDALTDLLLALGSGSAPSPAVEELLSSSDLPPEIQAAVASLQHEIVHARQQREATRLIVDAATLITAAPDIEEALEHICRRSKLLLKSDMAYISLIDPAARETYIRATDGVMTSRYRHLRMPLGAGILGQAAGGGVVAQTSGYMEDASISHLPSVDDAVRGEGVVSILAVSMRVHGRQLGALLVADRHKRAYTPSDVDLLTQIAGLAAVALQRAEQTEDLKAMLAERDKARAVAESQNALLHRMEQLDQAMFAILRDEETREELARVVGAAIGTQVRILHPSDLEGHRSVDPTQLFEHTCPSSPSGQATLTTAVSGQRIVGALEAHDVLDRDQRFLFERGTPVLTALVLAQERGWATDFQVQHQTIRDMETASGAKWRSIVSRMARYRMQEGATVRVMALRTGRIEDARNDIRELVTRRGGVTSIRAEVLRVISSNLTAAELQDRLSAQGHRIAVAEVETMLSSEDVGPAILAVQSTVRAMEALDITGVADPRWDLGLAGLAIASLPPATADLLVRKTLHSILAYDRIHGSQLLLTAWEYLESDTHVVRTAENLRIHPNTLRQRVARIGQVLGEDWHIGGRRADVHLALRLWRIQSQSGRPR